MSFTTFDDGDRLLNLRAAAARAGVGNSTLRQMLYRGDGPKAIKLGMSNRWRFRVADIDAWISAGERRIVADRAV